MGNIRLSKLRSLTRIAMISLVHLIAPTGFAVAATLQIQNETGFAMRVELVAMTSDDLPDIKDSLKALHVSNKQGGIIEVEAGRYFLLLSNPTGAWVHYHAIPWVTSGNNGWIRAAGETPGETFSLRITPMVFDLYSLERPNWPEDAWQPRMDNRLADDELEKQIEGAVQSICLQGKTEGFFSELGVWSADDKGDVTFFGRRGPHLCSLDDSNRYFFDDGVMRSYICDDDWRKCSRKSSEDLIRSNALLTPDGAYWLSESYREQIFPWVAAMPTYAAIRNLLPARPSGIARWYAEYSPKIVSRSGCPSGYRLHYQGKCINLEDEQCNEGQGPVRMVAPRPNLTGSMNSFDALEFRYSKPPLLPR